MTKDEETIRLKTVERRKGVQIHKIVYMLISDFILKTLSNTKEITLCDLLELADREIKENFNDDMAWYLLHVKQDLEAKGKIRVTIDDERTQVISISRGKNIMFNNKTRYHVYD